MSVNKPIKRPEKKSETIEVRVSHSEKLAFMEACKQAGTTASHAIRGYIGDVLNPTTSQQGRRVRLWAGLGAIVLVALTGALLWQSQQNSRPTAGERMLGALDHNGDGRLSADDTVGASAPDMATISWLIETADQNADGVATIAEISRIANVTIELHGTESAGDFVRRENVIIVPPGLSETERQEFIDAAAAKHAINEQDMQRILRLIEAATADAPD